MKKVRLISVALTLLFPVLSANALTVENGVVSVSGGTTVSGEVQSVGSTGAWAEVYNVVQSDGSNTNVQIDIQTNTDGIDYATSVSRTLNEGGRLEVRSESSGPAQVRIESSEGTMIVRAAAKPEISSSTPESARSFIAKIFDLLFFW